ncbi:MAG TPA: multiheme c-type cytochrome [Aggregatilinea sp.]|uniref:multiheme c-type cytochrome n=1 Tax=Aggregatilinea sp. TaxID=2806333 RepID=UPI002BBC3AB1|nr:multiheme c-type cytochrome [Aggregatilinea sp.]HML21954.1 multiheme c-type cytochrome [Aggregatilinea sp.]
MMVRRYIALASLLFLAALVAAWWSDARRADPVGLTPSLTGETEYCVTCHVDLPEISPSHPVETFGCVICHGGERLALDADLAHSTMRGGANPSDLAVVEQSCGGSNCHSGDPDDERDHIQRVMTSVQATYTGAIANIRYTFGAQPDLIAHTGIYAIADEVITSESGVFAIDAFDPAAETNPFVQAFGERCLTCHLSAEPPEGETYARLTGCAACHTPDIGSMEERQVHRLTTAIPYTQCNTCHNRGNYDLRAMEFVERTDTPTDRLHDYYQPIAEFTQCEYTLDCIDCHTRTEAMGDGDIHSNQAEIEYVQCRTCHGTLTELPPTYTITDEDDLALKLAFLNPVTDLQVGDTILMTEQGEPLWNTRVMPDGTYTLVGKATGQTFTFNPVMGAACQQDPDEQSSAACHECHAVER